MDSSRVSEEENPLTEKDEEDSQFSHRESIKNSRTSDKPGTIKTNRIKKKTAGVGADGVVDEYNQFFKSALRMSGMKMQEYANLKS